jgi:hypothetical protein
MTDMQITVRLGRKARLYAPAVLARGNVRGDHLAKKIGAWLTFGIHGRALSVKALAENN